LSQLDDILKLFKPIDLAQMDAVKLMDRQETKFAFHKQQLLDLLETLSKDYDILEVNGVRNSAYTSLYYDTPDFFLYHQHHNGRRNRYKVRHRTYLESDIGFFEVKFKNAKGRTQKSRISLLQEDTNYEVEKNQFIQKKTPINPQTLRPVVWINYKRMTLVSKQSLERLTIDTGLEMGFGSNSIALPGLVIAEVKQASKAESVFIKLMKDYHIRPGSLSKYCMAIGLTHAEVKKNRFKPYLTQLKKYDVTY
jgi:hypothetical protein